MNAPPVIWSVAGTDSGGGAGLAADQRAADAHGVHLCPVVAAVTAQNSREVTRLVPTAPELLEAQIGALAADMPPRVIKTGLLGGVEQVRIVARWVDRLGVPLVVDPVLGSSTGGQFVDEPTLRAYREELVPRATVLTPNRGEAVALAGTGSGSGPALRSMGAAAVCITGGDSPDHEGCVLDWLDTPQARGWLSAPRIDTPHRHGTGCTFATSVAAGLALGFVAADAVVLAKMATAHALTRGRAAGVGAGPVLAGEGFASGCVPVLSFGEQPAAAAHARRPKSPMGLYAIVDSAERVERALAAGVRTVQLRIKDATPRLRDEVSRSVLACRAAAAELFINDHWQVALQSGADGVHLGQEDLQSMGEEGRAALLRSGLAIGVSSHALWELCRARGVANRYIACGPVWPTLTKAMPWRAQGLHNLRWWLGAAGLPVAAIGGILSAHEVRLAAACGADGVCVVRALGEDAMRSAPNLRRAYEEGRAAAVEERRPTLPRPVI